MANISKCDCGFHWFKRLNNAREVQRFQRKVQVVDHMTKYDRGVQNACLQKSAKKPPKYSVAPVIPRSHDISTIAQTIHSIIRVLTKNASIFCLKTTSHWARLPRSLTRLALGGSCIKFRCVLRCAFRCVLRCRVCSSGASLGVSSGVPLRAALHSSLRAYIAVCFFARIRHDNMHTGPTISRRNITKKSIPLQKIDSERKHFRAGNVLGSSPEKSNATCSTAVPDTMGGCCVKFHMRPEMSSTSSP